MSCAQSAVEGSCTRPPLDGFVARRAGSGLELPRLMRQIAVHAMGELHEAIDRFAGARLLVLDDLILDRYVLAVAG